jgi:hypothetical protein
MTALLDFLAEAAVVSFGWPVKVASPPAPIQG